MLSSAPPKSEYKEQVALFLGLIDVFKRGAPTSSEVEGAVMALRRLFERSRVRGRAPDELNLIRAELTCQLVQSYRRAGRFQWAAEYDALSFVNGQILSS